MIRVNAFYQGSVTDITLKYFTAALPLVVQQSLKEYYHFDDKSTEVFGKYLLIDHLAYFGFDPKKICLIQTQGFKKPHFPFDFFFNISHSGQWVVCVASMETDLGVDIEKIKELNIGEYTDYLCEKEISVLNQSSAPLYDFFGIWTKKEAIIKGAGLGLSESLKGINTLENPFFLYGTKWHTSEVLIDNGYKCALASKTRTLVIAETIDIGQLEPYCHLL